VKIEIQPVHADHISGMTGLHTRYLPGFLTELGPRAVSFFYRATFDIPGNFGWAALDGKEVVGLIFGSLQGAHLYRKIFLKRPAHSVFLGLTLAATRTRWALKTAYWFLHPPQAVLNSNNPELIYIAVDERYRKFGLFAALLKNVFEYLEQKGCREFELSVAEADENARRFFEGMGARCVLKYEEGGISRYRYSISVGAPNK
jgi:GNAT superfamily N-acetyltransferase